MSACERPGQEDVDAGARQVRLRRRPRTPLRILRSRCSQGAEEHRAAASGGRGSEPRIEGETLNSASYFEVLGAEMRLRSWLLLPPAGLLIGISHLWFPAVAPAPLSPEVAGGLRSSRRRPPSGARGHVGCVDQDRSFD